MAVTSNNRLPFGDAGSVDQAEALRTFATGEPGTIGSAPIDVRRCEPGTGRVFGRAIGLLDYPHRPSDRGRSSR